VDGTGIRDFRRYTASITDECIHWSEGKRRLIVVLQNVLCTGITELYGIRTPVTKSDATKISDRPKQK